MNSKIVLSFIVGLALGGGGVYLSTRNASPPAEITAKLAKLETELAQKQTELKKFTTNQVHATTPDASPEELAKQSADSEKQMAKAKAEMDQQRQKMKDRIEGRLKAKVEEQLAVLKKKLGLNDAQMETVRGLLMDKLRNGDFAMKAMGAMTDEGEGNGSNHKDMEKEMMDMMLNPMKEEQAMDAKLLALLSPDQQAAYAAHKQEQKANKVEMAANKELAKLQGAMSLSNEQKDQIFSTLSQFAERESDKPIPGMIAMIEKQPSEMERIKKESGEETATQLLGLVDEIKQRQVQRREALKSVLSAEQMTVYENLQQASAFDMSEMMGDMGMEMMMMGAETHMESVVPDTSEAPQATTEAAPAPR